VTRVHRLGDTVCEQDNKVPWVELPTVFAVLDTRNQSCNRSVPIIEGYDLAAVRFDIRRVMSCVRVGE
jgi:hypothetical protein